MNDYTESNNKQIPLATPHTVLGDRILTALQASRHGLRKGVASARLERYGRNTLPQSRPTGIGTVFVRQFTSHLIYVLVAAVLLSLIIREWSDAGSIAAALIINAIIGTIQEYSAQHAAIASRNLVTTS